MTRVIRLAYAADEEALLALRQALWPETSEDQHRWEIRQMLAAPETIVVWVCQGEDGDLQGFAEVSLRGFAEGCTSSPVGYLEGWYVAPAWRRQGIGSQLMQAAEQWGRGKGCQEMASDTDLDNSVSEAAHRRLGFETVARILCFRKSL